jgi:chromosome partitioning protein
MCIAYTDKGVSQLYESDFVGLSEIAEMAGVSTQAVANWRSRFNEFPKPIANLKSGPVFQCGQIRKWLRRRRVPLATIISTINLKGGVAKTTTTVAIAEMLSAYFHKRVLLVDLDPQTNATTMLIGESKWEELNKEHHTLAQLFKDALLDNADRLFDLDKTVQRMVSNVAEVRSLDLLPSSLDLIDVQDRLGSMGSGRFFAENPIDILRRGISPIVDEYDYILIDCPPNLGIITLNGLRMSTGYIIPVIPDVLSTYGVPQIVTRVSEFARTIGEPIDPLGIVVSKYRAQSAVHNNTLRQMRTKGDAPVFKTIIPENNQIAGSAEYTQLATLRQKYGYQGQFDRFYELTKEVMEAAQK